MGSLMIDVNTDDHVLVPHARFCACRERRLRVVAALSRQVRDHASAARVLVGVVEPNEPEHRPAGAPVRDLRLVRDAVPVLDTSLADGHRPSIENRCSMMAKMFQAIAAAPSTLQVLHPRDTP